MFEYWNRPLGWASILLLAGCQSGPWDPEDYERVHEAAIGVYPPDDVPHGVVFLLYGNPTGQEVSDHRQPGWVEFELDGFRARAEVQPGDCRLDVANKLARVFRSQGVRVVVSPAGDWLICESPHGEETRSKGGGSGDVGLATGFRSLRS